MKKDITKYIILALIMVIVAFIAGKAIPEGEIDTNTLVVSASFYIPAHFAEKVGGQHVTVRSFTPVGAEPHDYEPTPRDMARISSSDVFFFVGAGLEPWAERIYADLEHSGVAVVEFSELIDTRELAGGEEESSHGHEHGAVDPHIWLDPQNSIRMVEIIADMFVQLDPEHKADFMANAERYVSELELLDERFREGLSDCARRDILVSHAAFGYLTNRYGLHMYSIAGLSPDQEPSPQEIARLATFASEHNLTHVFFETLVSPKIAQTIAQEAGLEMMILNPIGGLTEVEVERGEDYISIMEKNLSSLRTVLSCK